MPRMPVCVAAIAIAASTFAADPPSAVRPATIEPAVVTKLEEPAAKPAVNLRVVKFDPRDVTVRSVDRRWQLWSGRQLLKDFGNHHTHAEQARRLIAELNLSEHGEVGAPTPVMEFWLADGKPPPLTSSARQVVPFDPSSLQIATVEGASWLRDRSKLLYNFGPYRADADEALTLIKRFGFNEIAYIGLPNPTMSYLIRNDQPRMTLGARKDLFQVETVPQIAPRHPLQIFRLGAVGERTPFDPLKLELRRAGDQWRLAAGLRDLGSLGSSEQSARNALHLAQRYPFTEQCRVGASEFTFYLSRGAAPQGVPPGVRKTTFTPSSLSVRSVGQEQQIVDGQRVIFRMTAPKAEAQTIIKVLQHYQFDAVAEVGQLRYLVKER